MRPPRLAMPCSSGPPTASRQGQKSTASQDQARQSRTDDGTGDGHAVEHKGRVKRSLASDVGADP